MNSSVVVSDTTATRCSAPCIACGAAGITLLGRRAATLPPLTKIKKEKSKSAMRLSVIEKGPQTVSISPLSSFRSEEHTSEIQSLMRISYAVLCLDKQTKSQH